MVDSESPEGDAIKRLMAVRERIARAAERGGRDPEGVRLIAISKTMPVERVLPLVEAGHTVFGENRVQEALDKIPEIQSRAEDHTLQWRMVGHLQRNKVRAALKVFDTVDSVDSLRLLRAVGAEAERLGKTVPVLLEFNCSGDLAKSGFSPQDWEAVGEEAPEISHVDIGGLMTIGPYQGRENEVREAFRLCRTLRDRLAERWRRPLPELSMGMSGDLEIGIEEGATMVRVGTALFGPRNPGQGAKA